MHQPDTGILCFRIVPEGYHEKELNELQEFIHKKINAGGKHSLSITKLDDKTVLRLVAISPSLTSHILMETIDEARHLAQEHSKQ